MNKSTLAVWPKNPFWILHRRERMAESGWRRADVGGQRRRENRPTRPDGVAVPTRGKLGPVLSHPLSVIHSPHPPSVIRSFSCGESEEGFSATARVAMPLPGRCCFPGGFAPFSFGSNDAVIRG